ncbi:CxC2 domain-containing protein [Mycena chlorophos]|uniref:CxC2 domain-containing protein n=1 Tax=Mycena chlorophos TaxID=658473 RepID=A0A8H6W6A0_MYCCL|nr:CxC2 domain-containing protein [Mycena chlorophos]
MFGLEIEELQSRIRVQAVLKKAKSTASKINLGNMRRKADGMMRQWRSLQATYMPAALVRLKALHLDPNVLVENIPVLPPSEKERDTGCQEGLQELEVALRQAQCRVALVALRNQLHIKSRLMKYKKLSSRHQRTNTRTRTLVNRNESNCMPKSSTDVGFTVLKVADIRCMEDSDSLSANPQKEARRMKRQADLVAQGELPLIHTNEERLRDGDDSDEADGGEDVFVAVESDTKFGEGRRTLSWIWNETGTTGSEEELLDAMRLEWCKAFSRMRRWNEEIRMLAEEQRLVPVQARG